MMTARLQNPSESSQPPRVRRPVKSKTRPPAVLEAATIPVGAVPPAHSALYESALSSDPICLPAPIGVWIFRNRSVPSPHAWTARRRAAMSVRLGDQLRLPRLQPAGKLQAESASRETSAFEEAREREGAAIPRSRGDRCTLCTRPAARVAR